MDKVAKRYLVLLAIGFVITFYYLYITAWFEVFIPFFIYAIVIAFPTGMAKRIWKVINE